MPNRIATARVPVAPRAGRGGDRGAQEAEANLEQCRGRRSNKERQTEEALHEATVKAITAEIAYLQWQAHRPDQDPRPNRWNDHQP